MPYIRIEDRQALEKRQARTGGELNYLFTMICKRYLTDDHGKRDVSYQKISDILGALEGCKLELYARVILPYEAEKRKINGDVF